MKIAQENDRKAKQIEKRRGRFQAARDWISPVDPRENYLTAKKLQQKGTGKWFTGSKDFKRWKEADDSILWLYGSAGSGKTILS